MAGGHACVAHRDGGELAAASGEFLVDGLRSGAQLRYYGWGDVGALRDRVAALVDGVDVLSEGAVQLAVLDANFCRAVAPDPAGWRGFWTSATEAAVDAGFSGLRAVADTTPWLQHGEQRARFLVSEHTVDRYVVDHPLHLLCACDATVLTCDAVGEIASLHATARGAMAPFRVRAAVGGDIVLSGEVDAASAPLLDRVLRSVWDDVEADVRGLDLADLEFVEHHGLFVLDRYVGTALVEIAVRGVRPTARHLMDVLGLSHLRARSGW